MNDSSKLEGAEEEEHQPILNEGKGHQPKDSRALLD